MCPKIETEKKVVKISQVDVAYMSIFIQLVSYIIIIIIIALNKYNVYVAGVRRSSCGGGGERRDSVVEVIILI